MYPMSFNDPIEWWRHAVCYQVYVRSFADSDGDGIGDLPGITARLPYLRDLGVDALWITPFYTSPQYDHGYDVADYCDVDPLFGTLADADALLDRAHELGLRVIVDLVPNHTSSEHAWFRAALAAGPGSPERARYMFREGRGVDGSEPPNNWESVFGGPAWTRVEDGEWYLHLFDTTQPDLDWRNPEVGDMFEDVLRFWLDRGVDGFRIDVAHGLFKEESLRDQVVCPTPAAAPAHQLPSSMVDRVVTRRADVGPARGARRLPPLAPGPRRVRRRPDGGRRGLDPDAGVDGRVRAPRRAAPDVQLLLAARPVVGDRVRATSSPAPSRPSRRSTPRRPGCCRNHDVIRHADAGTAAARSAWPAPGPPR